MNKTLKTLATLGSGMVLLSFVVVVINQTAGVVQLAKEVNPSLGTATLWALLIAYGGLIGVPVVIVMRMPRPLVPPASETGPEFDDHLKRLGERLAVNPRVMRASIQPIDRRGIDDALRVLDEDANVIIKQMATHRLPDHGRVTERPAGRPARAGRAITHGMACRAPLLSEAVRAGDLVPLCQCGGHVVRRGRAG